MNKKTLHLIVNCTKSKSLSVDPYLMVRSLKNGFIDDSCRDWIKILSQKTINQIPALNLYSGGFWKIVKSFPDLGFEQGISLKIWICSGGYGLISGNSMISPYSATFSNKNLDSISRFKSRNSDLNPQSYWWTKLSEWEGPDKNSPRKISDLVERYHKSPIWLVVSNEYLKALYSDLVLLKHKILNLKYFAIFSTNLKTLDGFNENLIPFDARFQKKLGGSLGSINIRIAKKTLEQIKTTGFKTNEIKNYFLKEMNLTPEFESPKRKVMDDSEVEEFVCKILSVKPELNFTPLLRIFRDSGFACEYSRFFKIYSHVKGRK